MPEKKDIVIIMPAVPGTAIFANFIYSAYTIKIIEKIIDAIPKMEIT